MSSAKHGFRVNAFRIDTKMTMMGLLSISLMSAACSAPKFAPLAKTETPAIEPPIEPPPGPVSFKISETFDQDPGANKVDILIINDNSRSMYTEQQKMGERFKNFISHLKGIDYQIGMTTTDSNLIFTGKFGQLIPWVDTGSYILNRDTANADLSFEATLPRPETLSCGLNWTNCASADEQALLSMLYAYGHKDGLNQGFFRKNTDLAIVVLTDEDEMSTGGANATKAKEVYDFFSKAFQATNRNFSVHGLVIIPGDDKCLAAQAAQSSSGTAAYATHVAELASMTSGVLGSICAEDYAEPMTEISRRVRSLVGSFELKQKPKGAKLSIKLTPHVDVQYRMEGKRLIFDPAPPAGTKIEVEYEAE